MIELRIDIDQKNLQSSPVVIHGLRAQSSKIYDLVSWTSCTYYDKQTTVISCGFSILFHVTVSIPLNCISVLSRFYYNIITFEHYCYFCTRDENFFFSKITHSDQRRSLSFNPFYPAFKSICAPIE